MPAIAATDGRHVEIVASGLPLARGIPVAIDATIVSPLHADGTPWKDADTMVGTALRRAERSKDATYPELFGSRQLHLLTVACETGGRFNKTSLDVLGQLAHAKARSAPMTQNLLWPGGGGVGRQHYYQWQFKTH